MSMRLGVLDVGSNTVHLLVVDAHTGARPIPAFSHKVTLKLAELLEQNKQLNARLAPAKTLTFVLPASLPFVQLDESAFAQVGMKEAEAAAVWQGFVHGEGTGWRGRVELALPFSLVWAGRGIKTFTATGDLPVVEGEPVLFEIWVCADGYWADHTKNLVIGPLKEEYAELEEHLMSVYESALEFVRPGASMAELDVLVRDRLGFDPSHPICHGVGARAHEPPYPHQAAGGTFEEGMVLAVEPGVYWEGGGGLRVEDNFLVTPDGLEKLSSFPDGVVSC